MEKQILSKLKNAFETRNFTVAEELCLQELEKNTKQNIKSIYGQTTAQSLRVEKEILKSKTAVTKSKINRVSVCAIQPVSTGILVHPFYGGKDVCAHEIAQEAHLQGFDYAILPNPLKETWLEPGAYTLGKGRGVPVFANRLAGDGFVKDLQHHAKAKKRGNPKRWSDGIELFDGLQQQHQFTVIHTHYPQFIQVSKVIKQACPETPIVATLHNGRISSDYEIYDKLVFLTESAKQEALKRFPAFAAKSVVISPDVRAEFMRPAVKSEKKDNLLFVSTMREGAPERKGLDILLQALSQCKELKIVPLVIVGDGPDREKYEALAKELGVNTQFKGSLTPNEIITEIDKAGWFVMPSRHEPFGIVYLEAAVRGVPIIGASDAVTEIELRTGSKVGVAFDANATDAVSRLSTLLLDALNNKTPVDTSESGRKAMAQQIQKFFGHGKMANAYCDLFKKLSGYKPHAIAPILPEDQTIEDLISCLPEADKTILIQFSNSDAGLNAIKGVVDEMRKLYPLYHVVAVDMSDLIGNTPNTLLNAKIFDYTISLSSIIGQRSTNKAGIFRERTAKLFHKLFQRWVPVISMVSNDRRWIEEELVVQLRWAGIPVALLQESIRRDQTFPDFHKNYEAHGRGGCDLILAWGQQSVQYFMEVGVPKERIKVVGSPRLDKLVRSVVAIDKHSIKKKLGIEPDATCILMTTSPMANMTSLTPEQFYGSIEHTFNAIRTINKTGVKRVLLFRHHRSEYQRMEKFGIIKAIEANPYVIYCNDPPLEECLSIANGLINYSSTVAIEAGLVGVPIGILNFTNTDYGVDYVEKGIAKLLSSDSDLIKFISTIEDHAAPESTKISYYVAHSGTAEKQVAEALIALARKHPRQTNLHIKADEIRNYLRRAKLRLVEDPATVGDWKIVIDGVSEAALPKIYEYITELAVTRYEKALAFIEGYPLVDTGIFTEWPEITSILKRDRFEPLFHFYWHATLIRESRSSGNNSLNINFPLDKNIHAILDSLANGTTCELPKNLKTPERKPFPLDWKSLPASILSQEFITDYYLYTDQHGHAIKRYGSFLQKLDSENKTVTFIAPMVNDKDLSVLQSRFPSEKILGAHSLLTRDIHKQCELLAESFIAEIQHTMQTKWNLIQDPEYRWLIKYFCKKINQKSLQNAFKLRAGFLILSKSVSQSIWLHKEAPIRQQPMAFTFAANCNKHRSVSIAPHIYTKTRHTNRFNTFMKNESQRSYLSNEYVVQDEYSRTALCDIGVDPDTITINDDNKDIKRTMTVEKGGEAPNGLKLLVLLQNDYAHQALIDSIYSALKQLKHHSQAHIILKEHPSHPLGDNLCDYIKSHNYEITVTPSEVTLDMAIKESDIVVTVYSTAGIKAVNMGKTVLWAAFNNLDALFYIDILKSMDEVAWSEKIFKSKLEQLILSIK